jgi:two-component system, LytTR family, response regulator
MRILIADDEAPARAKVRRLLAAEADVEVVGEAATGREAARAIRSLAPDLVFLDIQMPELDGFAVIDAVGVDAMPPVVFVTAYDEYALRAFEVHALDYLLKPFAPERFRAVLRRARERQRAATPAALAALLGGLAGTLGGERRWLRRVLVQDGTRALLLPLERVTRIEAERNYVRLHTAGGVYQLRAALSALEARLDPADWMRANRSELVRLDAVKELHPWFHGDYHLVLADGTRVTWSRRFRSRSEHDFGAR